MVQPQRKLISLTQKPRAGRVFPISSLLCLTWRFGDLCFLLFCDSVTPQGSGSQTVYKVPGGSIVNSQNRAN